MVCATRRAGGFAGLLTAMLCVFCGPPANADAGWFESGDVVLRNDLLLLNDAQIIRLPVNQWPIPRAAVAFALSNAKTQYATNAAVEAALVRVQARLKPSETQSNSGLEFDSSLTAGDPALLRGFDTLGRENGELRGRATYATGDRMAFSLNVTAVTNPDDGDEVRIDGSHASAQLGNWLLSANTLDRYWGPSHVSSLILSNNARPMPTIMIERATAQAFDTKWLSWIGPWRMSFGMSQMEHEREDIDAPLFMAWRFEIMPLKNLDIGISRTAQFCGEQLPCSWEVFRNVLVGNDNAGIDVAPEDEPGNQMAGFDMRWSSPIGNWPYAIYAQYIGEDESGYVPPAPDAASRRERATEFARQQYEAYVQAFRLSPRRLALIGETIEAARHEGIAVALVLMPEGPTFRSWYPPGTWEIIVSSATARTSRLNRDDFGDVRNTVASVPTTYNSLEFGWRGKLFGQSIGADLGVEMIEPAGGERDVQPYGFVRWTHAFGP